MEYGIDEYHKIPTLIWKKSMVIYLSCSQVVLLCQEEIKEIANTFRVLNLELSYIELVDIRNDVTQWTDCVSDQRQMNQILKR